MDTATHETICTFLWYKYGIWKVPNTKTELPPKAFKEKCDAQRVEFK